MIRDHIELRELPRAAKLNRALGAGVQQRHGSGILVVANLLFDLVAMSSDVGPGVDDVLGSERWIDAQQLGLG